MDNFRISDYEHLREGGLEERAREVYRFLEYSPWKDYMSGARIFEVSPSVLGEGVLGMYDPSTHQIYISSLVVGRDRDFVAAHESGHALGYVDENKTDSYAASQVGFNLRRVA